MPRVLASSEKPRNDSPKDPKIAGPPKPISTELLNRYSMEHAKHGTCEHCGRPLELSPSSGLAYCPTCRVSIPEARDVWNDPKKVPFSQHLLIAVFWGAVMVLALILLMYFAFSIS